MRKKKSKFPFVSILIANFNGKDILKTCLPSLFKLEYPKDKYEVIVVDNNSSDGSVEFLEKNHEKVRIVRNSQNLGYVGINSALKYCNSNYIYFLNNDIKLDKNSMKFLVEEMEKDSSIGMTAHTAINYFDKDKVSGGTWVSRAMYCGHYPNDNNSNPIKIIPYLGVGLVRRSIISKYGYLFDPDYFIYAEDLDLGLRIRLLGMKVVQVKKAVIYHMHSMTMKNTSTVARNTFLLERNLLMTFLKIFSVKKILMHLPLVLLFRVLSIVKDLIKLEFGSAFARIKAIVWIIFNFGMIMKKRKQIQKLRKVEDSFILEVFSEKYILRKPFLV